ncbi:hypothetical protein C8R45DRAFT_983785 [Mycena sanguinolenta]|nr:hypothetical protein C8R45DRAFT_983785 [Mycena sanguinolenta]
MHGLPNLDEFELRRAEDPAALAADWDYLYDFIKTTVADARDIYLDKVEFDQLKRENSRLKHLNNALLMKLGTYCQSDYAAFPDEILLDIFHHSLPPSWLLHERQPMAPCAQDIPSVDLRLKLSILGVCKSWNRVGTGLLYERVTLRRITQLPVFVRALERREELRPLVKHVDINCFVPRGYSKLHEHETKRMLGLCPNLQHVGFSPQFWIPELPQSIPTINSGSITSLEFNCHIPYSNIHPSLVHLSQNLKSLTFTIPAALDEGHPVLDFPRLEDLCLTITTDSVISPLKWRGPVRRLWVYGPGVNELFDAYGRTIIFLRIHSIDQPALDRCPVLEHIAVNCSVTSLMHPRIRFIDTFSVAVCRDPPSPAVALSTEAFPVLSRCRNFDMTMSHFRYVPLISPQSGRKSQGERSGAKDVVATFLEFTDPTSVNGPAFIRNDTSGDYVFNPHEDDDSEGSEYVFSSDDDDEGSDTCSSDATSCLTASEDSWGSEEDYWEVGRKEALAIFDRTHDNH